MRVDKENAIRGVQEKLRALLDISMPVQKQTDPNITK